MSTKVYFLPLSAAEVDREILKLAEALRPDLIWLRMLSTGYIAKATFTSLSWRMSGRKNDG